ncbi:hypothetical protein N7454_003413 [Penicillium verhagenii]|nr:hypothetical protein N7454_003413 [Penicillium verhagenii]
MTAPEPPMSLEGHCSTVHDNTLYVYSPDGFASLPLERNTTSNTTVAWNTLSPGVNVTGAACVTAAVEGDADNLAFYVVGGSGDSTYSGLQRYSYQDQRWTTLNSTDSTTMAGRLGHAVGYLESNATILMYGGSVGSDTASQSTYVLQTTYPYTLGSSDPNGVPSADSPMLLKWNSSTVALIGGYTSTTEVYIYGTNNDIGWVASGATLPSDITSLMGRFAIVSDDDGNKILEDFNMDVSPNTITSYEIIKDGNAISANVTGSTSSKRSLADYPSYNSSNAGTTLRSDYAIAQSSNNLVVISSGSGNNTVSIFNQTANSWVNTTELFYGSGTQSVIHGTTTTSSTPTATASSTPSVTATPSSTAAAAASDNSGETGIIIGATLGSICGAIVILVAILFFLRRAKEKRDPEGQGKGGDGKDRLSFQDQGIEPLTEGAYPMAKSPVPVATVSDDSLAIMSGKYAGEKALKAPGQGYGYGYGLGKQGLSPIPSSGLAPSSMYSDDSDRSAAVAAAVEAISSPGNKPGDRTTDEGWGKYFDDNRATHLAGMQSSDRSTMSSAYTKSDYRGSTAWPMSNLAPLDFGFLDQPKPLGQVNSGSPTTEAGGHTRRLVIPESQSARISSVDSVSVMSDDDPHDTNWTGAGHSSWLGRPTSSNYSNSYYGGSNTNLPATNSKSYARQSNRRSSVIIPDNIDEHGPSGTYNSDMSWLNLHAER